MSCLIVIRRTQMKIHHRRGCWLNGCGCAGCGIPFLFVVGLVMAGAVILIGGI